MNVKFLNFFSKEKVDNKSLSYIDRNKKLEYVGFIIINKNSLKYKKPKKCK